MGPIPQRWLRQARADLAAAKDSMATGHHEWACFQAQQAAEKALKALLLQQGRTTVVSHSLVDLVQEAARYHPSLAGLMQEAKALDAFYLPTRYPNALVSEKAPAEYYSREDAQRCLSCAESILSAATSCFESSSGS